MESPLTHYEHEEYSQNMTRLIDEKCAHLSDCDKRLEELMEEKTNRLHDEDVRLSKRVTDLEENYKQLNELTISVNKLATSIQSMCKEQESIRKIQDADSARLRALEDKDGNKWRRMWGYIIPPLATLILGFLFAQLGLA